MSMRAALYARVSTEDQAKDGYSLDAQIEILRAYCESQDWEIAREYTDDGYSGRDIKRPAYEEMMSRMDEWDVVLVMKMDRIHRNSMNFMTMMEFLKKNKKDFASSAESLDTSSALGRFVMNLIQNIAQLESEQIGERTYMGMREKAESGGGVMGFTPPYGYRIENGILTEDENELPTVSDIFSRYLDGETVDGICWSLNRSGIRTRKGNIWNKYNLRNVLHNPVYAGCMRWDDVLIPHDASKAATKEEYNHIQEIMSSRSKGKHSKFMIP